MAKHDFDGNWKYYEMGIDNYPPQPEQLKLVIPDETNGKLEPGSKKMHDLTGNADAASIKMKEYDAQAAVDVDYEAILVIKDGNRRVLIGKWTDNNARALKRKDGKLNGQEEGTWVATKP